MMTKLKFNPLSWLFVQLKCYQIFVVLSGISNERMSDCLKNQSLNKCSYINNNKFKRITNKQIDSEIKIFIFIKALVT
jgi:hypothetical protein